MQWYTVYRQFRYREHKVRLATAVVHIPLEREDPVRALWVESTPFERIRIPPEPSNKGSHRLSIVPAGDARPHCTRSISTTAPAPVVLLVPATRARLL